MKKERYNIKGMHCSNCSIAIENSINKLEGIKKVDVNPIDSKYISWKFFKINILNILNINEANVLTIIKVFIFKVFVLKLIYPRL